MKLPKNIPVENFAAAQVARVFGENVDKGDGSIRTRIGLLIATMRDLSDLCLGNAVNSGWYTNLDTGEYEPTDFPKQVALMHSELSEALKAWNTDAMDDHLPERRGIEVELADLVIRVFNVASDMGLDVPSAIIDKLEYNRHRADHSLEARRQKGGKKC